ncbi:MAG: hypothetical protein JW787_04560 [Sedimentisphaerales bacterium]|nr:hypothetical protein [Sedimentisphaerales bacterium]
MKIQAIIHQQISQLKWQILVCVGLVMVLPVEEFIVGLKDGHGFSGGITVFIAFIIAPLLAGLIACSNVQAEMNDKLYLFWRSKPAGIKLMVAIKYFVGLAISIFIFACPVVFGFIVTFLYNEKVSSGMRMFYIPLCFVLAIMIYSLCFGLNVLIRNTARGWLIGILLTGFFLLLPFLLPLNHKDVFSVFVLLTSRYLIFIIIISVLSFVLSLFATQYDWHLKTNLKSLLWTIAGLVFVLLMLFSSQVANIKILEEKEIQTSFHNENLLNYIGDKVVYKQNEYISTNNDKISLSNVGGTMGQAIPAGLSDGGGRYNHDVYPHDGRLIKQVGDDYYCFYIFAHGGIVKTDRGSSTIEYHGATLYVSKVERSSWVLVREIDLSECLDENVYNVFMAMRIIENKLFVFVDNSLVTYDITNPEDIQQVDAKINVVSMQRYYVFGSAFEKGSEIEIPIVPAEGISEQEKIVLSIDRFYNARNMYESSIVDIFNGEISFYGYNFSTDCFQRYEVMYREPYVIKCRLKESRQSTFLEGLTKQRMNKTFVKNGKLYCVADNTLMVFDIHPDKGIRKLGHFVRLDYRIEDMAVLEDGNMVLHLRWDHLFSPANSVEKEKNYLYLLKGP